jgi:hypothetical protein
MTSQVAFTGHSPKCGHHVCQRGKARLFLSGTKSEKGLPHDPGVSREFARYDPLSAQHAVEPSRVSLERFPMGVRDDLVWRRDFGCGRIITDIEELTRADLSSQDL